MTALERIIVAADCTESSRSAVDRGFQIAARSNAELILAHGLGIDGMTLLQGLLADKLPQLTSSLSEEAARQLTEQANDATRRFGAPATVEVSSEAASTFVVALAQAQDADLVLLGGTSGDVLHRAIMGSTASRVQSTSPCPVLTVKEPVAGPYRRALVALDFSPDCEALVEAARAVAPDAELVLLHVFEVPFEGKLQSAGVNEDTVNQFRVRERERASQAMRDMAARVELSIDEAITVVTSGEAATQILEHEAAHKCDLIVVGRHNPEFAERLLLGSVMKKVLTESHADVLAVLQAPREYSDDMRRRVGRSINGTTAQLTTVPQAPPQITHPGPVARRVRPPLAASAVSL